jgi:hypothetical protein
MRDADALGRPRFLVTPFADALPWHRFGGAGILPTSGRMLRAPVGVATRLPVIDVAELGGHAARRAYGRPPLAARLPRTCETAAYLTDVVGYGTRTVAATLCPDRDDGRDHARRLIAGGRHLLHDAGVLPWFAFPPDGIPPADWWEHPDFDVCVQWWHASIGRRLALVHVS